MCDDKIICNICDKSVTKKGIYQHRKTAFCMSKAEKKQKVQLPLEVSLAPPQDLVWSPIESDNSTQYKNITNYLDIIADLQLQIQNLQLQNELLRQPIPTCETVNSDCQTEAVCAECGCSTQGRKIRGLWNNVLCERCGEHSDNDSEVVLSECDTVEIVPQIKKASYVRKVTPITVEQYSEKSFVVRGDTFTHKTKLSELGGKWNKSLTDKTTQAKFGAWVFSNSKRVQVDELISSFKK
jgi:hypothetical protein